MKGVGGPDQDAVLAATLPAACYGSPRRVLGSVSERTPGAIFPVAGCGSDRNGVLLGIVRVARYIWNTSTESVAFVGR